MKKNKTQIFLKKSLPVLFIGFFTLIAMAQNPGVNLAKGKPNVIVILADDFGIGDIKAHYPDNKIATPNLDNLVKEGMSFTDAHSSSAVCTPTRYGLMTGRYNWRTPLQQGVLKTYEPPLIKNERITLPEMLQKNGYKTACFGKWHLGFVFQGEHKAKLGEQGLFRFKWDYTKPITGGPLSHGFDYYFGLDCPNLSPFTFIENEHIVEQPIDKFEYQKNPDFHSMPLKCLGQPIAPDWRFEQILPTLTQKAVDYIHKESKTEEPFFLYFAQTSPHEPVVPSKRFAGKSGIAPIADFAMETDWSVGEVLKAVKDAGIEDNTLVLFTADNGHSHYTGLNELIKAEHYVSGPFRGYKSDVWEGGHRIPLIVKWKGKIAPMTSKNHLVCLTDVYATLQEMTTGSMPKPNAGEDSFSFLDVLFKDNGTSQRDNIVNHSGHGAFAYRKDGWKIVFNKPDPINYKGKRAIVELYHLAYDVAEKHNVAQQFPEKVQQLTEELRELVDRGTSHKGQKQSNDIDVSFEVFQTGKWMAK